MTALFAKVKAWAIAALAFILLIGSVFLAGRRSGSKTEVLKRREDELAAEREVVIKQAETAKVVNDVKQNVDSLGTGAAGSRLKSEWVRRKDR